MTRNIMLYVYIYIHKSPKSGLGLWTDKRKKGTG